MNSNDGVFDPCMTAVYTVLETTCCFSPIRRAERVRYRQCGGEEEGCLPSTAFVSALNLHPPQDYPTPRLVYGIGTNSTAPESDLCGSGAPSSEKTQGNARDSPRPGRGGTAG